VIQYEEGVKMAQLMTAAARVGQPTGGGTTSRLNELEVQKADMMKITGASDATQTAFMADLDTMWLLLGGILVFFMQPGFALLEAGSVRVKNTKNILFKNVCDAAVGALGFWAVGYSIAYADDKGNRFMGTAGSVGGWFMTGDMYMPADTGYEGGVYAGWFFQFAFAATAATIVSGAVAERIAFPAYMAVTTCLTCFIYPVVVHWGWSSTSGWASAFAPDKLFDVGVLDFAGCAIVHMVGGCAALVGVIIIKPRLGRFKDGKPIELAQQSAMLQALGTFMLWFGWYGFNCVSTLKLSGGSAAVAGKTAVTTTLSPAMACGTCMVLKYLLTKELSLGAALNGILAGLVGITSACSTVEPWAAVVIGMIAGLVYVLSSMLMLKLQLDDVVDAVAVHMACGMWGCIAPALFASQRNYASAYAASDKYGLFYGGGGSQLGANVCFILAVVGWVCGMTAPIFFVLNRVGVLRVPQEVEEMGMDIQKHGGHSFLESKEDANTPYILMQMQGAGKLSPEGIALPDRRNMEMGPVGSKAAES